jgi:GTP-binding protein EngB required for normal cell division
VLGFFNGYEKAMKRTAKKLDSMIGRLLEEHKQISLTRPLAW